MAESQNVEWKESWRDEYLKWICGFANAQGGKIYIGTKDDGKIIGVNNSKKLLEDIPNKIQNKLGIVADVNLLTSGGLDYIEIAVNPCTFPVNYDGEYHYRSGSTKQLLRGNALTNFLMAKTGLKWDAATISNIGVEDLDKESLDIFRREALRSGRMTKEDLDVSSVELLEKLDLMIDGKLKRAGALCFYREAEKIIGGCYIKIGKFEGSELLYQDEVHGSLIIMADRVIDLIYLKYLKAAISYHKETRVETYPFAREAVREAVYNALIHCNWADNVPVQIRIEDDAMYISNCSMLPFGWTVETLVGAHASKPYNPDIARVFYRAGYVESWGRGIQKIYDACENLGTKGPEYIVRGEDIMVKFEALQSAKVTKNGTVNGIVSGTVKGSINDPISDPINDPKGVTDRVTEGVTDRVTEKLSDMENKILEVLEENPHLTYDAISEEIGISRKTVAKRIKILKEIGIISREGSGKKSCWTIIKTSDKMVANKSGELKVPVKSANEIMVMFKGLGSVTTQATTQATTQVTTQATTQVTTQANQEEDNSVPTRILRVLQDDSSLSQQKMADLLGENLNIIKYYIKQMKKKGVIEREGTAQNGRWVVK